MDLSVNRVNPFTVNARTEQMLVQHERERDFLFYNKVQMNSHNIKHKQHMQRPNRAGVLRQIVEIQANETPERLSKKLQSRQHNLKMSMEEVPKSKINMFDDQQRQDGLVEIGRARFLDRTSKMPSSNRLCIQPEMALDLLSHNSRDSNFQSRYASNRNLSTGINYLKVGREQVEKPREYIELQRECFRSQLSIDNKQTETMRLKEYLDAEQMKLNASLSEFEVEKDEFKALL